MTSLIAMAVLAVTASAAANAEEKETADCAMHAQHMAAAARKEAQHDHGFAAMQERGSHAMGFAQEKTTHHFFVSEDGGRIVVTANSADDQQNIANIRMHLQHIAQAFAQGDFAIPMQVHEKAPPGSVEMKRLKNDIGYRYQEVPDGAAVVISSQNAEGVKAIHDFLQFQIREHRTGDAASSVK